MVPEAGAWLGNAAVAADFYGDGYDDLALGMPRGSVGGDAVAGEVLVLYGADGGLSADGHQLWNQDSDGVAGSAEPNDFFGWALAAGFSGVTDPGSSRPAPEASRGAIPQGSVTRRCYS